MKRIDITEQGDWIKNDGKIKQFIDLWQENDQDSYGLVFGDYEFSTPIEPEHLLALFDDSTIKSVLLKMSELAEGTHIIFLSFNPDIAMVYNPYAEEQFYLHTAIASIIYRNDLENV